MSGTPSVPRKPHHYVACCCVFAFVWRLKYFVACMYLCSPSLLNGPFSSPCWIVQYVGSHCYLWETSYSILEGCFAFHFPSVASNLKCQVSLIAHLLADKKLQRLSPYKDIKPSILHALITCLTIFGIRYVVDESDADICEEDRSYLNDKDFAFPGISENSRAKTCRENLSKVVLKVMTFRQQRVK